MPILVWIRSYISFSSGTDGGDKGRIGVDFNTDRVGVCFHVLVDGFLLAETNAGDVDLSDLLWCLRAVASRLHFDFFCV